MHIETKFERPEMTFAEMETFLRAGWGDFGKSVAKSWRSINRNFFKGKLEPCPIVITPTSPYGHWIGLCCGDTQNRRANLIYLTIPNQSNQLLADNDTLLHEMLHAYLYQVGEPAAHEDLPWMREITRISAMRGVMIKAQRDKIIKVRQPDGSRKSKRVKPEGSLSQADIARWPHTVSDWPTLGALGTTAQI